MNVNLPSLGGFAVRVLVALAVGALVFLVASSFSPYFTAEGDSSDCAPSKEFGVASTRPALWRLVRQPADTKLVLAFDDWVNETRRTSTTVRALATTKNKKDQPLRGTAKVGAFFLGALTTGERSLQFEPTVTARRSPDGRGILVAVCATRTEARESPGRYRGTLRVAGRRMNAVDIPVEVTIRAKRMNVALLALLVTIIGVVLAAFNAKDPVIDQAKVGNNQKTHLALRWAPSLSGLVAGLAAAFVLYADDPTWGAQLGADATKLLAVTFAAATGGLTVAAPPARAARERLAPPP